MPAQSLLDYIGDGFSIEQFLECFPSVKKEDAVHFLEMVNRKAS
ncbi:hypothetical protein [Nibricoccus sp. IMCC34717]